MNVAKFEVANLLQITKNIKNAVVLTLKENAEKTKQQHLKQKKPP